MTRTMRVDSADNPWRRAEQAIWAAEREGRVPQGWRMGREVFNRLKATTGPMVRDTIEADALLGLPFVVVGSAPPTMLELDEF